MAKRDFWGCPASQVHSRPSPALSDLYKFKIDPVGMAIADSGLGVIFWPFSGNSGVQTILLSHILHLV